MKYLNGEYYVEVKDHRYKMKISIYENELHHYLLELSIKYKLKLR